MVSEGGHRGERPDRSNSQPQQQSDGENCGIVRRGTDAKAAPECVRVAEMKQGFGVPDSLSCG